MASVIAADNPIVVDNEAGQPNGSTTISYQKQRQQELWQKMPGGDWALRTGEGDEAGSFPVTLKPGQIYEAGVYEPSNNPLSPDPIALAYLKLFCIWKKSQTGLITDMNSSTGGTWHWHKVVTKVPTNIIAIGASRKPSIFDSIGVPHLPPDGKYGQSGTLFTYTKNHQIELRPLQPGNHYFFLVVVTDKLGNWDFRQEEFTALRRKLTVSFPILHIYNDGDPSASGEGEFWFRVKSGSPEAPGEAPDNLIDQFHRPTEKIDDWSETDRPYPLTFAHVGSLQVVQEGQETVWVETEGIEGDGIAEPDEEASSGPESLQLPVGRFEKVTNSPLLLDAPPSSGDFHYGVDVLWSVDYQP